MGMLFSMLMHSADKCSVLSDSFWIPWTVGPPGSTVHGILQAKILEWVDISFSGDLPNPGIEPRSVASAALVGGFFTTSITWETHVNTLQFSSVQSFSRVRLFATPWTAALQPPFPSPAPRVHPNPSPLSQWCHPIILSSVVPFSSHPQSLQWAYNEIQGLLEVKTFCHLVASWFRPVLIFLFTASSGNLDKSSWFPLEGGAGYDSGTIALVTNTTSEQWFICTIP